MPGRNRRPVDGAAPHLAGLPSGRGRGLCAERQAAVPARRAGGAGAGTRRYTRALAERQLFPCTARRSQRAWANLYALAAFAESQGLANKAVEDPAERSSLTVALLQNQAVLMSLANPYRFSQRELVDLWTLTRDVANLVELTPQRFSAAGSVVLIDVDAAPTFFSRAPNPDEGDVLWVDLRKLDGLMRATLSHAGGTRDAVAAFTPVQPTLSVGCCSAH